MSSKEEVSGNDHDSLVILQRLLGKMLSAWAASSSLVNQHKLLCVSVGSMRGVCSEICTSKGNSVGTSKLMSVGSPSKMACQEILAQWLPPRIGEHDDHVMVCDDFAARFFLLWLAVLEPEDDFAILHNSATQAFREAGEKRRHSIQLEGVGRDEAMASADVFLMPIAAVQQMCINQIICRGARLDLGHHR